MVRRAHIYLKRIVNFDRYVPILHNFFLPKENRRGINTQQDGATVYTARAFIFFLLLNNVSHITSQRGDML